MYAATWSLLTTASEKSKLKIIFASAMMGLCRALVIVDLGKTIETLGRTRPEKYCVALIGVAGIYTGAIARPE